MPVPIIILNWNGIADTQECLESVFKQTYSDFRVYLLDNGSNEQINGEQDHQEQPTGQSQRDGKITKLKPIKDPPGVKVLLHTGVKTNSCLLKRTQKYHDKEKAKHSNDQAV